MKCTENGKNGKFIVHGIQLKPKNVCKHLQFNEVVLINSESEVVHAFRVRGELVLELVVAKYWDSYGEITMDYSLHFHGIKPDSPSITMHASDGIHSIELSSGAKVDRILPVVTLKQHVLVVRPSDSTITALTSPRDIIPPSRYIYENVLTYNFHMNKGCEIIPYCPVLCDVLYESEYESQLWMLFDVNKQLLASGDAYPQKYVVKVEKGDYVLKLHVRHEKKDILDKLSDLPLLVSQKLANSVNMDVYGSQSDAMICGKKMSRALLPASGQMIPIYIGPLPSEKVSKLSTVGQYLTGNITYAKDELGKKVDTYPFKYVLGESCKKSKNSCKDTKEKTRFEEYTESVTESKIEWLGKLDPGKEASALYEELKTSNPENLAVHTAMLQCLEPAELDKGYMLPFICNTPDKEREEIIEKCKSIISVADVVINSVDRDQLLAYSGMINDMGSDASNVKTQMEKQKTALIDAYCRKGCALCRLHYLENSVNDTGDTVERKESSLEGINNVWKELLKFSDPNDTKVIYFMMWHSAVLNHYGRLAKYLQKLNDEKLSMAVDNKLVEVYKTLNWKHCEQFLSSSMSVKYPTSYRLF
ncbi:UNVERIFIED_CONTAM: hypothetical protein PYX00_010404 [Menopon gallinae]|uniref:Tripeptidyl-peptidase 2 n=1 Tax=Menopon gallinae TaxID=328185 RepID=A0AAW2HFK4_9NEOP